MNILSIDIEEWAIEATRESGARPEKIEEYNHMLDILLQSLSDNQLHATCFCTGKMAEHFPDIVRRLQQEGHEIACHSYVHTWCNKLTPDQLREDTHAAISALEQCIGQKVIGYRAPAFSITEKTPYAFEILAENGIEYDASVFPAARDFGGWPSFGFHQPVRISLGNIELKEFPVPTMPFMGKQLAYSGGGYFRFFPYTVVRNQMKKSEYSLGYFHINDLLSAPRKMMSRQAYESYFKEPGTFINRIKRYLKANIGTGDALAKLQRLLGEMPFITIHEAMQQIDWENTPVKQLR